MSLKKKWNNIGIKKKLFLITTSVILITSIVIYGILIVVFPKIYLNLKEGSLKSSTNELIKILENNTNEDYRNILDQYTYNIGGMVLITNLYGEVIYPPNRGFINSNKPIDNGFFKEKFIMEDPKFKNDIKLNKEFYFKEINTQCILSVNVSVKFLNDMERVMISILPYIILITIGIGILAQYIYSSVISRPLIKINNIAKKISKEDFKEKLYYSGEDEISELSNSINLISSNLEAKIKKLRESNSKLLSDIEKEKKQDKRRRDFIKVISHELKTPITAINGQIEGMIYNIGPYKDRDKYLRETLDSVNDLRELVLEIINIGKYEENIELNLKNSNINYLIKDLIESYDYFIKEKDIKINVNEEDNLNVVGDENILGKVFSNLINNSIKYALVNSEIKIDILKEGRFKISNYSKCLNELNKEDIFKAFYRGEESRNKETGGSGLGLYIVKTLLDIHEEIDYGVEIIDNKFEFYIKFNKII